MAFGKGSQLFMQIDQKVSNDTALSAPNLVSPASISGKHRLLVFVNVLYVYVTLASNY